VASLEDYLSKSTIGEFSERLKVLDAFAAQMKLQKSDQRLSNLLRNLVANYGQYSLAISTELGSGLAPIEKEIQDFVKLQTWEDRGYFAMKKNGERAKRKLHRLCLKAQEVLKKPVAAVLSALSNSVGYNDTFPTDPIYINLPAAALAVRDTRETVKEIRRIAVQTELDGIPLSESLRLNDEGLRYNQLSRVTNRMVDFCSEGVGESKVWMDDYCETIVDWIRLFKQERSKSSRNRKKKALSDFLKFLPEIGISRRRVDIPKGALSLYENL